MFFGICGALQILLKIKAVITNPATWFTRRFRKRQTRSAARQGSTQGGYGENVSEIATRNLKGRLHSAGVRAQHAMASRDRECAHLKSDDARSCVSKRTKPRKVLRDETARCETDPVLTPHETGKKKVNGSIVSSTKLSSAPRSRLCGTIYLSPFSFFQPLNNCANLRVGGVRKRDLLVEMKQFTC